MYLLVRSSKKAATLFNKASYKEGQITILEGELTKENLGIDDKIVGYLKGKVDVIYHTAALLSFNESERENIFHVNVDGTRHVLNFAETINVNKFIHVSTAYTLGVNDIGVEALYSQLSEFRNSYEESKCKAEQLVMTYKHRFEVIIMRPAIIIGHSETGESNTTFGLYGIIRAIGLLKKKTLKANYRNKTFRLLINKEAVSNLVPVDYVIKVLILVLYYGENETIYNITNPTPPKNKLIFDVIKESLDIDTAQMVPYTYEPLLTQEELTFNKPIGVFQEYLNFSVTFKDDNTRKLLIQSNNSVLNMDREMLSKIIGGFIKQKKPLLK